MSDRDRLLRTRGLEVALGGRTILADVELELHTDQMWFLLGANGAGKTTFVRALLGLVPVRRGSIEWAPQLRDRSRIGFVPQHCALATTLPTTVREFVILGRTGLPADSLDERRLLTEALATVGLSGREHAAFWSLSGGQRQRAMLARALIRHPALLLLDEPTTALDPAAIESLLEILARLATGEQRTVVVVSHDLDLARRFATHVALLRGGRVHAGPAQELLAEQHLARLYPQASMELR